MNLDEAIRRHREFPATFQVDKVRDGAFVVSSRPVAGSVLCTGDRQAFRMMRHWEQTGFMPLRYVGGGGAVHYFLIEPDPLEEQWSMESYAI